MNKLKTAIPFRALLYAGFYGFGAVVLLVSLFADLAQINGIRADQHGVPASTEYWILPVITGLS